ncbi:GNAT family N-acetyltransferase [Clostridium bornimense]|uniref:GNAT family N-acetyltransferase n=1 Tax=Clostridium bornimense TaxID=1216932 RepID=UPI001C11B74D|nr:GNAT family N-acetyltransferase [Clostridium bornimense]MBU5316716.1 GNAT family N-acetyltransferase [Clostridium bornimense]
MENLDIEFQYEITVENYNKLRKSVGWIEIPEKEAKKSLNNSVFIVAVKTKDEVIASARVVGDKGYIAVIFDVMVDPRYQHIGIGTIMIERIIDFLFNSIDKGDCIYITLFAEKNKEGFYKKFGFTEMPTVSTGPGMFKTIWK